MSKISIKDATIRIKPSAALCAYVAGLGDVLEMPANILSVHRLFGGCAQDTITVSPAGSTAQLAKPTFSSDDMKLLKELSVANSNNDDKDTAKPVQFMDILNITSAEFSDGENDGESSDDNNDEDTSELGAVAHNKNVSKSRAKRIKEQRKERQRERVRLTLADLIWLNTLLTTRRRDGCADSDGIYLHQLLAGSNLSLPRNEIHERDPALEARCVRLRLEQDARVYNVMTKNVDSSRRQLPDDTIAYQMKSINKQMIAVAQFLFSVAAGFAFGFIGVELLIGNLDFGFRLLLGIICALVIALAEIYFLAKQLNEEYDISVAEEKVVLKSPPIEDNTAAVQAVIAKVSKSSATTPNKPHAE